MKLVNIYNNKREIHLFCRDEKGQLQIIKEKSFFPYFYELDPEGKFQAYDGKSLRKIFVSSPSDVPKQRTTQAYEADILFTKRYMIDKITKLEKCPIKYAFIDIEVLADELPNVKEAKYTISCISIYNSLYKSIQTYYLGDYGININDETRMIKDFINYMKKEQFDLWLSWNVEFDYTYLFHRIKRLKSELQLAPKTNFSDIISPINKSRYGGEDILFPAGISIVDYLTWFKKITLNREKSYALDSIAQTQLKEEPNEKIAFDKLDLKIKEKNIHDIERMVKLEEKFQLIPYHDEIRRLAKVEWEDMIWNSRIIDMLLLQEAKNQNVILSMKPSEERATLSGKEEYEGAYREAFETGHFENVGKYDLSSAYPYAIIDFCLDSANIDTPKYHEVVSNSLEIENTWFKQNPNALLPIVVKKLITLKNEIKQKLSTLKLNTPEYKDTKQKYDAIKSIVNSAYGVFGNRFFRLYDKRVASATTFIVRSLLHYVQEKIELKGYKVIYVDTDGVFIDSKEDLTSMLNDLIKQWAKEIFNKDKVNIEFGYEGNYESLIILAKCRYKGWLRTGKGLEVETKGIEAKRKDSTEFMKKFQTELLDKIKNKEQKENIFAWIKDQIKILPNQSLKDVAFPCKLGRKMENYISIPIFVRALKNTPNFTKKVGELFYYIFIEPKEYEEKEIEKNVIMTYDKEGKEKGFKNFTLNRLNKAIEVTNMDLRKDSDGEELNEDERLEKLKKQGLYKSECVMIKGKAKDVIAFDEDNYGHVKDIDWKRIIERNIIMKLETIFQAMGWKMEEVTNVS